MVKSRLEAFSDGVIAIIITIMVLEMKVPHGTAFSDLVPLAPVFLSYVLSFIYVGIYWHNHHHLFHAVHHVDGKILWANSHLLFWLSLTPFVTNWMGETHFAKLPVAVYGCVLLMSGVAYFVLTLALVAHHGPESTIARALGADFKGKISLVLYVVAVMLSFVQTWVACAIYALVAIIWLIPDRRIERVLSESHSPHPHP